MNNSIRTAYLRDASGNIMAVYQYQNGVWTHQEQHLYGAERLGVHTKPVPIAATGHNYAYLAVKKYELTNHLGNVMAVVTDRRFVHASGTFATAEVVSATDYFPFGMEMTGRTFSSDAYSFGFNTQMKSPEILPGHTTAMYWEYDSRIGRRWELDPKTVTGWSGYACLGDSPIFNLDFLGDKYRSNRRVTIEDPKKGKGADRIIDPDIATYEKSLAESLSNKTGLVLGFNSEGFLEYAKDANGAPIIRTDGIFSEEARKDLKLGIDDENFTIRIDWRNNSKIVEGGNAIRRTSNTETEGLISLDPSDLKGKVEMDIGFVFLHENLHGYFGLIDADFKPAARNANDSPIPGTGGVSQFGYVGQTVTRENIYRSQLQTPIRMTYEKVEDKVVFMSTYTYVDRKGINQIGYKYHLVESAGK